MASVGYARVSTEEQNLDSQLDELKTRCDKIFTDKISGARAERPGLQTCLEYMRDGDVLVVTKLDRLARSLKDLIQIVENIKERNISFMSIQDKIETTTPQGKFFFHVFGAVAEFERDLIRQRTQAGLTAARARGRVGGRKPKMTPEKIDAAKRLLDSGMSPNEAARQLVVSRATLYNHFPGRRSAVNKTETK